MESLQAMQRMLFREQARVKEFELLERARVRRAARRAADVAVLVANSAAFQVDVLAQSVHRLFPSYRPGGSGGALGDDAAAASHVDAGRVPFAVALALILCGYACPVPGDLDAAAGNASLANVSTRRMKDESRREAILGVASTPRTRRAAQRTELLRAAVDLRRMSECTLLLRDDRRRECRRPANRMSERSNIEVAGIPIALHAILASMHGRGGNALARGQPLPGVQLLSGDASNSVVMQRVLQAVAAEQTPAWEALLGDSVLVEIERVRAAWRRDPGRASACAAPGLLSASAAADATPSPSVPSLAAAPAVALPPIEPVAATVSTPPPHQRQSSAGAVLGVRRLTPLRAVSALSPRCPRSPSTAHASTSSPLPSRPLLLRLLRPSSGPRGAGRNTASAHRRGGNTTDIRSDGRGASDAEEAALARHFARRSLYLSRDRARSLSLLPWGRHNCGWRRPYRWAKRTLRRTVDA